MSKFAIFTKNIITPDTVIPQGVVLVEGKKILEVGHRFEVAFEDSEFETLHFEQKTLVPGFIDVHIHGARGRDVMEGTREAVEVVSRHLALHGTTSYLATTVTASPIETIQAVESLGKTRSRGDWRRQNPRVAPGRTVHQSGETRCAPARTYSSAVDTNF